MIEPDLIKKIRKDMKDTMPGKRYQHTLGVAYTAASLAMCHQCDMDEAYVAGLLHDSAKYYSEEALLEECRKQKLPINEVEQRNPYLLHGKVGAVIAKEQYDITEADVLNAITYHTTGRPEMSLLEQILFVADYIEPGRKPLDGLDEIRYLAFHDLEACVIQILEATIQYLSSTPGKEIDDTTKKTYMYYTADKEGNKKHEKGKKSKGRFGS